MRDILAAKGLNSFMKMIMRDNFLHGDLHPGNILVRYAAARTPLERLGQLLKRERQTPHLVLLDTGMIAELSSRDRDNLLEFFRVRGGAPARARPPPPRQPLPPSHSLPPSSGSHLRSVARAPV